MGASLHVALLRGINVGGKNRLAMADLAALFTDAGAKDVRTYIQSGNVVFGASAKSVERIASAVVRGIAADHGLEVPIVLRSGAELARVLAENPYLAKKAAPEHLHVAFLAHLPAKKNAAALDPERSPGDALTLRGRDLYLHLPNGAGKTKITNVWLDKTLGTVSTVRNWRTVTTLAEMAGAS